MNKKILQITIKNKKRFKTRFEKKFYIKIWFPFWYIFRPKILSIFFKILSNFFRLFLSKEKNEQIDKEIREEYSKINIVLPKDYIKYDEEYSEFVEKLGKEFTKELKIPADKFGKK